MKTQENFGLSQVEYINQIFPLIEKPENMPVSFFIDELRDCIIDLSKIMICLDNETREELCSVMLRVSGTCKMLSEMRDEVINFAINLEH